MNRKLYEPSPAKIAEANITAYMQAINARFGLNLYHYPDLYQWSIDHLDDFWASLSDFCDVEFDEPATTILKATPEMLGSEWFVGAKVNYAKHALRFRDERVAIRAYDESGHTQTLTYAELYQAVAKAQHALRAAGLEAGDRVAAILPNIPETLIMMLAATAMGAIWSSCSPDFGEPAILDRFGQIQPKILVTVSGYRFKGRQIDCQAKIESVQKNLAMLTHTIWVPQGGAEALSNAQSFEKACDNAATDVKFSTLDFNHPLFILYSSGTTGMPKCIVHGHGGTLLQHMKELKLHTDIKRDDSLLYLTTCGWMMWNWMASTLTLGATLVLFEGNPLYPENDRMIKLINEAGVSVFGTSAKFIAALASADVRVRDSDSLATLKAILSTGSPLSESSFAYVYESLKKDVQLSSISGGTDIISCFALGCPILPVYQNELQCRGLGMAVEVWNEKGEPVSNEEGELVCTKPFVSMPVCFWDDPKREKYRHAYFEKFQNVWTHGDYAMLTDNGGLLIFGRSDSVLNPGGVRIGTAEIYRVTDSLPEIQESLAVSQKIAHDERIILFVILKPEFTLTDELVTQIKAVLKAKASPRHVPAHIIPVSDFPRTHNGKLSEKAVSNVVNHLPISNAHALMNPDILNEIEMKSAFLSKHK